MAKDYIKISANILNDPEWAMLSDAEWTARMKILLRVESEEYLEEIKSKPYDSYLNSPHWKRIREKKLLQSDYCCENCGSNKKLQIHHLTYKNIGKENLEDLMVLCIHCHRKIHHKEI